MARSKTERGPASASPRKSGARRSKASAALPRENAELLLREAGDACAEAEALGDPTAAWEVLDELLAEIPAGETELRRQVQALRDRAGPASTAGPTNFSAAYSGG